MLALFPQYIQWWQYLPIEFNTLPDYPAITSLNTLLWTYVWNKSTTEDNTWVQVMTKNIRVPSHNGFT